jgi:hypothetical protein
MKRLLPLREFQPASFRIGAFDYYIRAAHQRHQYYQRSLTREKLIFDSNWIGPFEGHISHTSFSGDYFAFIRSVGEDGTLHVYKIGIFRPKLIFQTDNVFRIAWGKDCIFFSRLDKTLRSAKV